MDNFVTCKGHTLKGKKCRNVPQKDSEYCKVHRPPNSIAKADKKPQIKVDFSTFKPVIEVKNVEVYVGDSELCPMLNLAQFSDVFVIILIKLPFRDLQSLMRTCKGIRDACYVEKYWKMMCTRLKIPPLVRVARNCEVSECEAPQSLPLVSVMRGHEAQTLADPRVNSSTRKRKGPKTKYWRLGFLKCFRHPFDILFDRKMKDFEHDEVHFSHIRAEYKMIKLVFEDLYMKFFFEGGLSLDCNSDQAWTEGERIDVLPQFLFKELLYRLVDFIQDYYPTKRNDFQTRIVHPPSIFQIVPEHKIWRQTRYVLKLDPDIYELLRKCMLEDDVVCLTNWPSFPSLILARASRNLAVPEKGSIYDICHYQLLNILSEYYSVQPIFADASKAVIEYEHRDKFCTEGLKGIAPTAQNRLMAELIVNVFNVPGEKSSFEDFMRDVKQCYYVAFDGSVLPLTSLFYT
jgi:hypothetical protein